LLKTFSRSLVKGQSHSKAKCIFPAEGYSSTHGRLAVVCVAKVYQSTVWHHGWLFFHLFVTCCL